MQLNLIRKTKKKYYQSIILFRGKQLALEQFSMNLFG